MTHQAIHQRGRVVIGALFFFSGFSALIYEVLWVRMLTLSFGNTAQAAAAVMATLFGGFAIGALAGGRLTDMAVSRLSPRNFMGDDGDPPVESSRVFLLQVYGILELGIGLYALATPFLFRFGEVIFVQLCRGSEEASIGLTALKVFMSFLALVIPSSLMGATLPLLSKCVSETVAKAGSRVGYLYALNTWGGVAGTFLAGFVMIPFLGVTWTLIIAAITNAAIAGVVFAIAGSSVSMVRLFPGRQADTQRPRPLPIETSLAPMAHRLEQGVSREGLRVWLLTIVAISGMTSLAYEVLWTRTFIIIFGADIYAFTAVLATFLTGIGIGSYFASRLIERRLTQGASVLGKGLVLVACAQIIIGITALALLPSFDKLPYVFFKTRNWVGDGWFGSMFTRFAVTFALTIVPTALLGATFPLAVRLYTSSLRHLGSQVGEMYASNTLAAIFGSLAAGFFLIPVFGVEWSIKLTAVTNLALGACLLVAPLESGARIAARVGLVGAALLLAVIPGWNQKLIALAQLRVWSRTANSFSEFKRFVESVQLPFYEEGVTATVGVAQIPGLTTLTINGKPVASTGYSDVMVEHILGFLPTALSKNPKRALVIGLGTGVTLSGVPTRPGLKVDCVEISPEVAKAARTWFAGVNHKVLENRDVRLVIADARQFLLLSNQKYDIITSDPIHPWAAGSVNLYTHEFYLLCRERLAKDGVMCQWLPMYQLSDADMKAVLRTFSSVFPHTTVWACAADLVVIGTAGSIQIDLEDFVKFFRQEQVADDLAGVQMASAFDIIGLLLLEEEGVARITSDATRVTDDRPSLEFTTPRYYSLPIHCDILKDMLKYRHQAVQRLRAGLRLERGMSARDVDRRLQYVFDRSGRRLAGQASRSAQQFMAGLANLRAGNTAEAIAILETALVKDPSDAEIRHYLALAYLVTGDGARAKQQFEEAVRLDPDRDETFIELAKLALAADRPDEAFARAKQALDINPWAAAPHNILALVYLKRKLLVKAEEEFLLALAADPRDVTAQAGRARLRSVSSQAAPKAQPEAQDEPPGTSSSPSRRAKPR